MKLESYRRVLRKRRAYCLRVTKKGKGLVRSFDDWQRGYYLGRVTEIDELLDMLKKVSL